MSSQRETFNAMLAAANAARGAAQAVAPGLSPTRFVREVGAEVSRLAVHGRAELAQALFSQSNAYVPYGVGQQQAQHHMQRMRGGREM